MTRTLCLAAAALLTGSPPPAPPPDPPTIQFIEVEPGVRLEVLDWGGTGRPIVLLGGYGRTAHDFDTFGPALSARYHAFSVTRRGFGTSSKPATGYTADRLGDDVLAVIDSLGLVAPLVAAHSLGGEELSSIGSRHPERVAGLIYLDAAYGYAFYDDTDADNRALVDPNEVTHGLEQLAAATEDGRAEEVHRLITRLLETDLPALQQTLQALRARVPTVTPTPPHGFAMRLKPGVDESVFRGLQRYQSVRAPVLSIYALKGMADASTIRDWNAGRRHELVALKRAAPTARVLVIPEASHDVFRSHEQAVIREIGIFVDGLPARPNGAREMGSGR